MPIYSFRCMACRHVLDLQLKVGDRDNDFPCPRCKNTLSRGITPSTFILKGNMWAKDGYTRTIDASLGVMDE